MFELYSIPSFPSRTPELVRGAAIGSTKQAVTPGTVLVSKINPRINRVWVVGALGQHQQVASTEWISFAPVERVEPTFLAYYLQRDHFRNHLASNVSGVGGSLMRVRPAALDSYPFALPSLDEQRRIVAAIESYVSRLDAATATLERVQRNLERYRASVLKAAVEGRLVPTEAELAKKEGRSYEPASVLLKRIVAERRRRWEEAELAKLKAKGKPPPDIRWKARYEQPAAPDTSTLPDLPDGWCWATVDVVGDVLLGRRRAPEYSGNKRPYLRVANVRDDRLDLTVVKEMPFDAEHFERHRLSPGDILVSEGQSPELVGQSAIFPPGLEPMCFQSTLHRFRAHQGVITPNFAQIVFRSHVKTGVFRRFASITTNIAHLVLNRFRVVPVPLPPLSEQLRIVEAATRLLAIVDHSLQDCERHLARIARLRQSILKWAFEGRLVARTTPERVSPILPA